MLRSIFVSSTFRDMNHERDIIHSKVIPAVNSAAHEFGDSVTACDLRWGIDTSRMSEDESSLKVLNVCLNEIDRCRPYMIVILGYRYGWLPGSEKIGSAVMSKGSIEIEDADISVTALEIEYGSLCSPENIGRTLFYFREIDGAFEKIYSPEDIEHEQKLRKLKERIQKIPGSHIRTYHVSFEDGIMKGMEDFAAMVVEDVKALLSEEWKKIAGMDANGIDQLKQWEYLGEKSFQFAVRYDLAEKCITEICDGHKDIFLHGVSGCGKSTLVSFIGKTLKERGCNVVPVFCGYTSLCSSGFDILQYMVRELENKLGTQEHFADRSKAEQYRLEDWENYFESLCRQYDIQGKSDLVFIADGVNQLTKDEAAEKYSFIPSQACGRIRFVISSINADNVPHILVKTEVNPLLNDERLGVIRGIMKHKHRELHESVVDKILEKKNSSLPLYLELVIQRLLMMNHDDFQSIVSSGDGMEAINSYQRKIIEECPDVIEKLSVRLLYHASKTVGGRIALRIAELIAASRRGLRFSDIHGIMKMQNTDWNELDTASFIQYMGAMFIYRNDGRYDFSHAGIRRGILAQTFKPHKLHSIIAEWLFSLPKTDEIRMQEVLFHLSEADKKINFAQALSEIALDKDIDTSAMVKDTVALIQKDGGIWVSDVVKECFAQPFFPLLSGFLNQEVFFAMPDTYKNLLGKLKVCEVLHIAEQKRCAIFNNDAYAWNIAVAGDRLADIHIHLETKEHLEFAIKILNHSIFIRKHLLELIAGCRTPEKLRRFAEDSLKNSGLAPERSLTDEECRNVVKFWRVEYERGLCVANGNIAEVLKKLKRYDEALLLLQEVIDLREDLQKRHANFLTGNEITELASVYTSAASIYLLDDREDSSGFAEKYFSTALQLLEDLLKRDKSPATLLGVCSAKMGFAEIYFNRNDISKSLETTLEYLPFLEQINTQERNSQSQHNLSMTYRNIGLLYENLGDTQKASIFYEKSKILAEDTAARMPSNDAVRFAVRTELDILNANFSPANESADRDKLSSLGGKYNILLKLLNEIPSESTCEDIEQVIDTAVKIVSDDSKIDGQTRARAVIELKALALFARLKINPEADTLKRLIVRLAGLSDELMKTADKKPGSYENILRLLEGFKLSENDLTASDSERAYTFLGHAVKLSQKIAEDSDDVKDYDFLAVSLVKYSPLCRLHGTKEEAENINSTLISVASRLYKQTGRKKYAEMIAIARILKTL